jgi:hypothetical protein
MYLYRYHDPRRPYSKIKRSKKMTGGDNKELIEVLKRLEKLLSDIKYDLADIKREMPKVPYYGDLLQDIVKAIENMGNSTNKTNK